MRLSLSHLVPLTHTQVCIVTGGLHSCGDGQREGCGLSISGGRPDGTDSYLHAITPTQSWNMSKDDILDIILSDTKDQEFWAHVGMSFGFVLAVYSDLSYPARSVPPRRVWSVYDHVQQIYHPFQKAGRWTKAEDARLVQ